MVGDGGYSGEFAERLTIQRNEEQKWRNSGESESGNSWNTALGDYSRSSYYPTDLSTPTVYGPDSSFDFRDREHFFEPQGLEETFDHALADLLHTSQKRPIVAFDFGGGLGVSWCRLAKKYAAEVQSGDLLFVVSNMEHLYDPTAVIQNKAKYDDSTQEVVMAAQKNSLVHYVEGELSGADSVDVHSLRQMKIEHNGTSLPLFGNCDLISCRESLSHSEIPEIHIPRIMELLSPQGMYVDSTFSPKQKATPAVINSADLEMASENTKKVYESYKYCQEAFDLKPVTAVEQGEHQGKELWATVLKKSACPIKVSA